MALKFSRLCPSKGEANGNLIPNSCIQSLPAQNLTVAINQIKFALGLQQRKGRGEGGVTPEAESRD